MHINAQFLALKQLGVGPESGYFITGYDEEWENYILDEPTLLNSVKDYIYLKVRLVFDPPGSSFVIDSIKSMINEIEWRMLAEKELQTKEGG